LGERDRLRLIRVDREPFFGEPNSRRHHLAAAKAATAVARMCVQQAGWLTRHDGRPIAGVLHVVERPAPAIHPADAGRRRQLEHVLTRGGGRRTRAIHDHRSPIRPAANHHGRYTANTTHGGFHHANGKAGRDGCVNRVTARPQNLEPGRGSERVHRRHHAVLGEGLAFIDDPLGLGSIHV